MIWQGGRSEYRRVSPIPTDDGPKANAFLKSLLAPLSNRCGDAFGTFVISVFQSSGA
jgi:hypothetical protein